MIPNQRSEVGIDLELGYSDAPLERSETPFCLLVIGDFAGQASRSPLAERRALAFDRDSVDEALRRLAPVIRPESVPGHIQFRELEGFHPDQLFASLPLFAGLRGLRARLLDPRTFAEAARELSGGAATPAAPPSVTPTPAGGSLLDRLVAETVGPDATSYAPDAAASTGTAADDLAGFIRQIVRHHLVPDPDPRQAELVRGVDAAAAAQLRALLRDPAFRAQESAWRTIERLARRIETSTSLRLYLLDVSAAELDAALGDQPDGAAAELARVIARAGEVLPDGGRWTALVVLRSFGADEPDHARLARLGLIARALRAPAFVDAAPGYAGLESWTQLGARGPLAPSASPTLAALRASAAAAWLCLAAPRVLLREPYGGEGEPVESFDFDELADGAGQDAFLWGSAGAVCALLLAHSFELNGWSLRPGQVRDLDGLPLPSRRVAGESELVPCAETLLTDEAAERLMDAGITPLATMRGTDTVHVVRFQSLASPPTALAGPWTD